MKIILSTAFKKDYKRFSNNEVVIAEVDKVIILLAKGKPLPREYKEHPLSVIIKVIPIAMFFRTWY
jgi:mRNA-degrading endonuclease YafQ of YafQ-DinJ toxin-antitoxin module